MNCWRYRARTHHIGFWILISRMIWNLHCMTKLSGWLRHCWGCMIINWCLSIWQYRDELTLCVHNNARSALFEAGSPLDRVGETTSGTSSKAIYSLPFSLPLSGPNSFTLFNRERDDSKIMKFLRCLLARTKSRWPTSTYALIHCMYVNLLLHILYFWRKICHNFKRN